MKQRFLSAMLLLMVVLTAMGGKKPKYIFYFIGDGMGMSPMLCAETYNRTVRKATKPLLMLQFPVVSMASTHSANKTITDSAAAGTALATGHKTNNGMLGQKPDGTAVQSIAWELKQKGYGVAIATNVAPDDATPAAFYAHVPHRGQFYDITLDMAKSNFDFFAGGKLRGKPGKNQPEAKKVLQDAGYSVVEGKENWMKQEHGKKVVLLNSDYDQTHIGYTIDSIAENLSLPFITRACIEHMEKVSPQGFFIMIEGGLIDHALHPNDGGTAVKEILNLDESLQMAYDFYLKHPDETLIVLTADHNTGGMTAGVNGGEYVLQFKNYDSQRISMQAMQQECKQMSKEGKIKSWEDMKEYLQNKLGFYSTIKLSQEEDSKLREAFQNTFIKKEGKEEKTLYLTVNQFVQCAFHIMDQKTGIGWTTLKHTGDVVPVCATGVGSELFQRYQDNTDIPKKIRRICKIENGEEK